MSTSRGPLDSSRVRAVATFRKLKLIVPSCTDHYSFQDPAEQLQVDMSVYYRTDELVLTSLDVWQDRLIHYVSSDGVIYLVLCDDAVGRRMPFAFLAELERIVGYLSRESSLISSVHRSVLPR